VRSCVPAIRDEKKEGQKKVFDDFMGFQHRTVQEIPENDVEHDEGHHRHDEDGADV
jgi:hypothetical protein